MPFIFSCCCIGQIFILYKLMNNPMRYFIITFLVNLIGLQELRVVLFIVIPWMNIF